MTTAFMPSRAGPSALVYSTSEMGSKRRLEADIEPRLCGLRAVLRRTKLTLGKLSYNLE
jgi:hypothetical protein